MKIHGMPVWYELTTDRGKLDAAADFYAALLGWRVTDAGMAGMDYRLGHRESHAVAGLMEMPDDLPDMPARWTIHFGVDDADAAVARVAALGGTVHRPVTAIPGTGRFAIAGDPHGAGFGLLEPLPMDKPDGAPAFDPDRTGHGSWQELRSPEPQAALDFYGDLLGWQPSTVYQMGAAEPYRIVSHDGTDVAGVMALDGAPAAHWLPYFSVEGVTPAAELIAARGGRVMHGPSEVPGEAFIVIASDPQGAPFGIVGPLERRS